MANPNSPIRNPNASLEFWDAKLGLSKVNIWLETYAQTHAMSGSAAQSQWFQHFYAKSYTPGNVKITGRVPTQTHYNRLANFIRKHQGLLVSQAGQSNFGSDEVATLSLMKLRIPSENYAIWGFVPSFRAGMKRFNPAPPFEFEFVVIQDDHSYDTAPFSKAVNNWFFSGREIFPSEVELMFPGVIDGNENDQDQWDNWYDNKLYNIVKMDNE